MKLRANNEFETKREARCAQSNTFTASVFKLGKVCFCENNHDSVNCFMVQK